MNQSKRLRKMVLSALLIAVGIIIPVISPIKVVIEPMSFTLASHVAIMVAMFISPEVAIAVALGTTVGFFLGGFPIVVVLRALTHVIWAGIGAYWLKKDNELFTSLPKALTFNFTIALIHAVGEVAVCLPFYMGTLDTNMFVYTLFGLVGLGTIVHSSVDMFISVAVWKAICRSEGIQSVSQVKKISFKKAME